MLRLLPLIEAVPLHQRIGAIIKGEHGLPVRCAQLCQKPSARSRATAKIPDEIWNMDARAGGATEAEEAGATLKMIQGALTHTEERTTLRYIRRRSEKIHGRRCGSAQRQARNRKRRRNGVRTACREIRRHESHSGE